MLKELLNPLDRLLKKAKKQDHCRFLICWNRGLGDIPLGLYAFVHRIRAKVPFATVTFMTRQDLAPAFEMLKHAGVLVVPSWKRGVAFQVDDSLEEVGLTRSNFDVIIEKPDPTKWVSWQLGTLIPRLEWDDEWDELAEKFGLDANCKYLGAHVDTETGQYYGYEKNWPLEKWKAFFTNRDQKIVVFGRGEPSSDWPENVIDLRGKTSFMEMQAIIKKYCSHLLVPDSGVLSTTYYLAVNSPLRIVSLWSDPGQGVLRQNVPSPNPSLVHVPLIGEKGKIDKISVEEVEKALVGGENE